MIFNWFQSKYQSNKDKAEIAKLCNTHGDNVKHVIHDRLKCGALSSRDRKHWKRIARKL